MLASPCQGNGSKTRDSGQSESKLCKCASAAAREPCDLHAVLQSAGSKPSIGTRAHFERARWVIHLVRMLIKFVKIFARNPTCFGIVLTSRVESGDARRAEREPVEPVRGHAGGDEQPAVDQRVPRGDLLQGVGNVADSGSATRRRTIGLAAAF